MNVFQLQLPPQPQPERVSKQGSEKDADFLALRLLNKRSRLRLSPKPIQLDVLPGKGRLFAVANNSASFAAAIRNPDGSHALVASSLASLRSALVSSTSSDSPPSIQQSVTIPLPSTPHIITFTNDSSRLLVAFTNGLLNVYDAHAVFQGTASSPLHTFPSSTGRPIRDICPCTGDAEQIAILREPGDSLSVELVDVQQLVSLGGWNAGGSPGTNPTTLSWSPKGKQIAIGLESGDIVSFSPTDTSTVQRVVPQPPSVEGQSIISITWLSNTEFHGIFAPASSLSPDVEQTHLILSLDPKANAVGDVKLTSPYLPFPGLRPPGSFVLTLRSWEPSRLLLFVGDSTSSDIGLIGSLSDSSTSLDSWYHLTLEETSTPSVPLDADLNETVILGLELDLTAEQSLMFSGPSGEETQVPPPPVMYLYASDGTITGWHIIQTQGVPYPGMVTPDSSVSATSQTRTPLATQLQSGFGAFGTTTPTTSPFFSKPSSTTPSIFGQTSFGGASTPATKADSPQPTFGSSSFGGPSAFGSSSFFGKVSPASPSPFNTKSVDPASNTSMTTPEARNAFSAFTGSAIPFGAAAVSGSGKSFGDMLREKEGDQKDGSTMPQTPSKSGQTVLSGTTVPADRKNPSQPTFGTSSFGAPSASGSFPGKAYSATPSPLRTPTTPSNTLTTTSDVKNAFGAFAGSASPFGAADVSQLGKSFGEMLREKEGDRKGDDASGLNRPAEAWKKPASTFPSPTGASAESPAAAATPGGAFSGLTTSSTGFSKLQPGFGAFGATATTSSPFFSKPGSTTPQTSSIFGQTTVVGHTMLTKERADPSQPTFGTSSFGSPSAFGSSPFFGRANSATPLPLGKVADPITTSNTLTTTHETKNAFGAFTESGSPFGSASASGSGKTFGDMLREQEGDQKDDAKGISKTAEAWKKPVSVFASLKESAAKTSEIGKDEEEDAEGEQEDEGADTSFRSHEDEDEDEVDDGDDGIDAFLKSDEEDMGSGAEEEQDSADEDEGVSPSKVPPGSPTVKQTTAPKALSVCTPTTPSADQEAIPSKPMPARASSTTPPGSPADRASPTSVIHQQGPRASSAPPTSSSTASSAGGLLAPGRPSTRPMRSSPLASRPISSADEEEQEAEEDVDRAPSPSKKARSESPAISISTDKMSRPKTPPALFGVSVAPPKPSPFNLAPSTASSLATTAKSPLPVTVEIAEPPKPPTPSASPSLSGPGIPGSTSLFGSAPPVFTAPAALSGGLLGPKPPAVPPQTSLFGDKPSSMFFGSGSGSLFSSPPAPGQSKTSTTAPPPIIASPVFSSVGASVPAAKPPLLTGMPTLQSGFPTLTRPSSVPPPQQAMAPAQDIQSEFANLYLSLNKELEDLRVLATQVNSRAAQLGKPGSGAKTCQDLHEPTKWALSDLSQLMQIMKEVERELEKWQSEKATCVSYLWELESDLLKGSTREEEIERFSRASKDSDFARMLKARMLNPEHLETQSQLRREIRTIRNRLQQLEDYIQASKKKLNCTKKGKPTLKPPSLDTINRTYRNIDTAIEQEEEAIYDLRERLAALAVSSHGTSSFSCASPTRDRRLPERNRRVGREVTPNIAASTAAALNAERSAQKLKRALLNARKEPLLNSKAVDAVPPERELHTPRKPLLAAGSGVGAAFVAGLNGEFPVSPAGSTLVKGEPYSPTLPWTPPPPGNFSSPAWLDGAGGSPLSGLGGSRRGREKQHARPIQLHQGQKPPPPPPPAGFSWGPVPVIQPKSTISIFAGSGDHKGEVPESNEGLGGSWVGVNTPKK